MGKLICRLGELTWIVRDLQVWILITGHKDEMRLFTRLPVVTSDTKCREKPMEEVGTSIMHGSFPCKFCDQAGRRSLAPLLPVETISIRYCSLPLGYFAVPRIQREQRLEYACARLEVGLRCWEIFPIWLNFRGIVSVFITVDTMIHVGLHILHLRCWRRKVHGSCRDKTLFIWHCNACRSSMSLAMIHSRYSPDWSPKATQKSNPSWGSFLQSLHTFHISVPPSVLVTYFPGNLGLWTRLGTSPPTINSGWATMYSKVDFLTLPSSHTPQMQQRIISVNVCWHSLFHSSHFWAIFSYRSISEIRVQVANGMFSTHVQPPLISFTYASSFSCNLANLTHVKFADIFKLWNFLSPHSRAVVLETFQMKRWNVDSALTRWSSVNPWGQGRLSRTLVAISPSSLTLCVHVLVQDLINFFDFHFMSYRAISFQLWDTDFRPSHHISPVSHISLPNTTQCPRCPNNISHWIF